MLTQKFKFYKSIYRRFFLYNFQVNGCINISLIKIVVEKSHQARRGIHQYSLESTPCTEFLLSAR